jgi:hypothetical protein
VLGDQGQGCKDRGQSYIEKEFSKELGDLADAIESEYWFGDHEKHDRYRVDFILKDARYSDPKSIGDLIFSSTRGLSPLPVHESNRIAID